MSNEVITLGSNFSPPVVCLETSRAIYDCARSGEFDVATFNAILMAIVTYLDAHDVYYRDKELPWAELIVET